MSNRTRNNNGRFKNELQEFFHIYDSNSYYKNDRRQNQNHRNSHQQNQDFQYKEYQQPIQIQYNYVHKLTSHQEKINEVIENQDVHQDFLLGDSFKKSQNSKKNQELQDFIKQLQQKNEIDTKEPQNFENKKNPSENLVQQQQQNQDQQVRVRKSRLQQEQKNDNNNILQLLRIQLTNLFTYEELIDEDEVLNDPQIFNVQQENTQGLIPLVFQYKFQQYVKQLRLKEIEILTKCWDCQNIMQIKTQTIIQYNSPAIKAKHCNQLINILFLNDQQYQQFSTQKQNFRIGFIKTTQQQIVLLNAQFDVYCQCGNKLENPLILDSPLKLSQDNYILGATQYYRKLCHQCCKEVLIQDFELYI